MSCRTRGAGLATKPAGVARPALPCAGSRLRPWAVGYLRLWPHDPPKHADTLTTQLRTFAHQSGLVLADVYTEHTDVPASREGAVFRVLVEALRRPHITTMIIPAEHFSRFKGMYRAMCTAIATETTADIVIMSGCRRILKTDPLASSES
jgi:hypothetical protein